MMKFSLRLNMFFRSFFLQAGWNFVKYQNIGLTFVMLPFLTRLYKHDKEALPSVISRYLDGFNTQPVMASFCFGALAQKEEEAAKAKSLTDFKEKMTEWTGTKRGLSITTASIGDRLFWGTLKPMTLLVALFVWLLTGVDFFEIEDVVNPDTANAFGAAAAAFLIYNTIALFVRWQGLKLSFESNERTCFGLTKFDWNKTIYNAKRIGLGLATGLILFGVYHYFRGIRVDLHFVTRAVIVLFFVMISFLTRKLKIPNLYLYLAAVVIFNIACYL